jgi:hypothetical protein
MRDRELNDLLARRMAGEDVTTGQPQVSHEPIAAADHPDGDVKIGKSLRVPLALFDQINAVAQRRRLSWSALVREWIVDGLARDAGEAGVDPVVELHHHLDAATRALRVLEGRDAA